MLQPRENDHDAQHQQQHKRFSWVWRLFFFAITVASAMMPLLSAAAAAAAAASPEKTQQQQRKNRRRREDTSSPPSSAPMPATTRAKQEATFGNNNNNQHGANGEEETPADALFLLCSVDGSIYALDAWSGQFRSSSRTGVPLITRSPSPSARAKEDNLHEDEPFFSAGTIHPGLDGKLYWQSSDGDNNGDGEGSELQALPVSIPSLLEHPVQSCTQDGQHCGILTAVAHNTLLALDPESGALRWSNSVTDANNGNTPESPPPSSQQQHTLLLQRKDFAIQHISSQSGKQLWNVTMGSYQAVQFQSASSINTATKQQNNQHSGGTSGAQFANHKRIDDDDDLADDFIGEHDDDYASTPLPLLRFGKGGREISAILPPSGDRRGRAPTILWRIESPHVLTSVFGIQNNRWRAVEVVEEEADDGWTSHQQSIPNSRLLPAEASSPEADYAQLWQRHYREQQHVQMHRRQQPEFNKCVMSNGQNCPNAYYPGFGGGAQYLALPAPPPPASAPSTGSFSPNRMVLLGVAIGCGVTVLLVVVVWMLWLRRQQQHQKQDTAEPSLQSRSLDVISERTPEVITSSVSFPGAIRRQSKAPDPGESMLAAVADIADGAHVQSDPGADSPDKTTAPQAQPPTLGGISTAVSTSSRYASEFEELQVLGRGGFGTVFRCRNRLDDREYAMKKVTLRRLASTGKPTAEDDAMFQQEFRRLLREVVILARLDHPNIVRYYTAWLETEEEEEGKGNNEDDDRTTGASDMAGDQSSSLSPLSRKRQDATSSRWGNSWQEQQQAAAAVLASSLDDDCGFSFADSSRNNTQQEIFNGEGANGSAAKSGLDRHSHAEQVSDSHDGSSTFLEGDKGEASGENQAAQTPQLVQKHTLYIQMQLCRFDTVADFLLDQKARSVKSSAAAGASAAVDIPAALALFTQIAKAVQHVHEKELIHRDLKPSNCFMDEDGVIKVGDFGLSRETSGDQMREAGILAPLLGVVDSLDSDDHTAGVGTRLYASPEQTEGSSYDASTDVYSLGIILFELCYPMYTGMERNICLSKLRQQMLFPSDWDTIVGSNHGQALKQLILSMLDPRPPSRPSAAAVVQEVKDMLGELTILSPLGSKTKKQQNGFFLQVESSFSSQALALQQVSAQILETGTVRIIRSAMGAPPSHSRSTNLMEFELERLQTDDDGVSGIMDKLKQLPEIDSVRNIVPTTAENMSADDRALVPRQLSPVAKA